MPRDGHRSHQASPSLRVLLPHSSEPVPPHCQTVPSWHPAFPLPTSPWETLVGNPCSQSLAAWYSETSASSKCLPISSSTFRNMSAILSQSPFGLLPSLVIQAAIYLSFYGLVSSPTVARLPGAMQVPSGPPSGPFCPTSGSVQNSPVRHWGLYQILPDPQ